VRQEDNFSGMLQRPRRNRNNAIVRAMTEETRLTTEGFVFPLFVTMQSATSPIPSMPGIQRFSKDDLLREIESCLSVGLKSFVLFPAIDESLKDNKGSYGVKANNFYVECIREIRNQFPEVFLISDVALDPYSSDGHDGLVDNGVILNDATVNLLSEMALLHAQAGVDMIGPSDMMDGRVGAIRRKLDASGFYHTGIISYTAKYASAYYGPFRDALESAPRFGDKKTYQMNPANRREALREARLDEDEGADILMVKPALCYLDIIHELRQHTTLPIAAYNVSGEYAMLKAAAANGWIDYQRAMPEMLLSIKRAGADIILTYFAKEYCTWISAK
jgi:porphobilinogen synthase